MDENMDTRLPEYIIIMKRLIKEAEEEKKKNVASSDAVKNEQ